ncbi:MAG TPA: TAXI family TRAP transporter solute-binding subunit [Xanthobacteraceae bacterium]|nr:TAXI family TRAP transporter solute-binding subunit [Xanthobacteraceae bacterium]
MEPLPKGANFIRGKTLWEIGLHIAGNPATPYGGNRDMVITVGSGSSERFRPWLRLATGSAILAEGVAKGDVEAAFVNPSALLTQAYRGVGLFAAPLPVRIIACYPSWDRFVMALHPRTGIRAVADIKAKKYPLRLSVREDPTHSTIVLIDQILALHGFKLADIESWGGRLVLCGGPGDQRRRLEPLRRGEIDAIFDEGIKTWLDEALAAGLVPIGFDTSEYEQLGGLGWRRVSIPKVRFPRLAHDVDTLDFSGWPIYASASLPEQTAYDICAALTAREAEIPWEEGTGGDAKRMVRETEATPMDVPLHPGAARWLREHG